MPYLADPKLDISMQDYQKQNKVFSINGLKTEVEFSELYQIFEVFAVSRPLDLGST